MLVLGWYGGITLERPHQDLRKFSYGGICHDAAAVLVDDGKVVAAIEEERLSRLKHTGKLPVNAVQFCLDSYGVNYSDIDKFVFSTREQEVDLGYRMNYTLYNDLKYKYDKDMFCDVLYQSYGMKFRRENLSFVEHHISHASSAYYMSGFDRSLILTIDGASSEGFAGYVISADGDSFNVLHRVGNMDSLGALYIAVIRLIGYLPHDEYKVMGLAPYGDPSKYRDIFNKVYTLLPEGRFQINWLNYMSLYNYIPPRGKGEGFTQEHKDLAATLQEALEVIVMHMLEYYRKVTGHTRLCMAGGVAHNCSMNGKILYSGLFDEVFVQPAAHDAGTALGAALYVSKTQNTNARLPRLQHLYWGTNVGENDKIHSLLKKWEKFLSFKKDDNIIETTARLIADGYVVGWVQGRSEFGPRALGNRSILADPRPPENKTVINAMVKKREGYRPFAPSIMEEYLGDFYEVPQSAAPLSFMNFVLQTKRDKWDVLGAVTHVDGSARVQTVSKETNRKYWELINEFRKLTGIPVLLNTSFNNNVEPIVDSEEDAIVSFLTTKIHYLVIGDYLITKNDVRITDYMDMLMQRPIGSELKKSIDYSDDYKTCTTYRIRMHFGDKYCSKISENAFNLLESCNGEKTLNVLFNENNINDSDRENVINEILQLWSNRLVILRM